MRIEHLGRTRRHRYDGDVSHFFCTCPNNETLIIYGVGDEHGYPMKENEWELVCAFMRGLLVAGADVEKSSTYTNENIPKTNQYYRSNVPAICRAYCEEEGGMK